MGRYLLATIGSLGDLHPFIALGLGLIERGHSVTIATSQVHGPKVEAAGLKFHPIRPAGSPEENQELAERVMDPKLGPEIVMRELIFPNIKPTFDDLLPAVEAADVVVLGELLYSGNIAAEKLGKPWVYAALAPTAFFSPHDPPVLPLAPWLAAIHRFGPAVNAPILNLGNFVTGRWTGEYHDLRSRLGLQKKPNPIFAGKYSPFLNLAVFSSALGAPQPDWPENTVQTGFVFFDRGDAGAGMPEELERFLGEGEPPIVFTLGSAAVYAAGSFYEESAEAVRRLGRRAVLLMGKNKPPFGLGKNILAVDYAPFSELFHRAEIVVHQGGVGTTAQGLRAGKPTIIVPFSHDQPDNAARAARLGVSKTIRRADYRAETVSRAIVEIEAERSFSKRAAEIGARVAAEDGISAACAALERVRLVG